MMLSRWWFLTCAKDECAHSGEEPDSDEDVITDYHISNLDMLPRTLPTISVTPHSPANKLYPVLEDHLQQLRELHECVQQMRNMTIQDTYGTNFTATVNPILLHIRYSTSCPGLYDGSGDMDSWDTSLGSSPQHQPPSRKPSAAEDLLYHADIHRRNSWSAVEDLTIKYNTRQYRQRSISLSSMESDVEESSMIDNVDGSTIKLLNAVNSLRSKKNRRTSAGATSTHSLNDADLQNDFMKIKLKRDAEQRLIPQRLPLQKSVSTPSIVTIIRDLPLESNLRTQPAINTSRRSITESETEEETIRSNQSRYSRSSDIPYHTFTSSYDGHTEKRRKRGSIFFRKKKEKHKKNLHDWVSACYGSSHTCTVCNKLINNKPALYCEYCGKTVHQNVCKDNITDCTKRKSIKNSNKMTGLVAVNSKNSMSKRGSSFGLSTDSHWISSSSHIMSDDRDTDSNYVQMDHPNFSEDMPLIPLELMSDVPIKASDLCSDLNLGFHESEADSWTTCVGKDVARKLKEKEVKRQEHIYEFILTEKHHCITLLVMQKIFVDGLQKYFQMGSDIDRIFPRLSDLIELHLGFLSRLRGRQRENLVVSTIADILLEQFSNHNSVKLKSAYGEFCSKHREAVGTYKCYVQNDVRFEQFIRHCQTNPLLRKKGIPECILFVTQRLTKYPLLIEPLIKTTKDNKKEQDVLQKTLHLVKNILVEVDAKVAEKEKDDRKLEIYHRIDTKSYTIHRDYKFKKSDILVRNRLLKFEGVAMLMQGRGKMQIVMVIVLSDVLFFLQENSSKYTFFTPDNKAGVISLQKLLVREKAGQDTRGIYLISSNPSDPEMFELKVHKPKDKQVWIHAIREAVQACPEEEEPNITNLIDDHQHCLNTKQNQIRHLIGLLRQKDIEHALLLEEKMALQLKLCTISDIEYPLSPSYRHLVGENNDTSQIWKEVLNVVQDVSELANSFYATGVNLSRSVSSAGEHQSETFVSPILPKRAETFGGFDNAIQAVSKSCNKKINYALTNLSADAIAESPKVLKENNFYKDCFAYSEVDSGIANIPKVAPVLNRTSDHSQLTTTIQLSHHVYTLLCIISQLMTTNDNLQSQINTFKGSSDGTRQHRHNQQLEELRNLQDKLSAEKTAWTTARDHEQKELQERKEDLLKLQEQIRTEQEDVKIQREQLFRTMEKLTNKGIIISPNVGSFTFSTSVDDNKDDTDDSLQHDNINASVSTAQLNISDKKRDIKINKSIKTKLPINLLSTTNQQKVSQNVHVKQQIPFKLASSFATHLHTRTGSSPAMMEVASSSASTSPMQPQENKKNQSKSGEQDVIYF